MKRLLLLSCLFLGMGAIAQSNNKTVSAKISPFEKMLGETGYEFAKADTNIFVTKIAGNKMKDILVVATQSEGMIILFSIVKEKAGPTLTVGQYRQLMKITMEYDRIKIGLDDEENLMVRIDLKSRLTDTKDLTENLEQIGVVTDEAFGILTKN